MAKELSDEDVFGSHELSDSDVFGEPEKNPSMFQRMESGVTSALKSAGSTLNETLNPFSEAYQKKIEERIAHPSNVFTDWTGAGEGIGAAIGAVPNAIIGGAAPLVAEPLTSGIQAAGEPIARALNPSPKLPSHEEVYRQIEPEVQTALGLTAPGKTKMVAPRSVTQAQQLFDAASGDYAVAKAMGVKVKPDAVTNFARGVQSELENDGLRDYLAPKTFNTLKEMQSVPTGGYANISDIDGMRKVLGHAARDFTNPSEQLAANRAIHALDDFSRNISPQDVLSGDLPAAQRVLENARGNWAAGHRAELLESKEDQAVRQAASTGSGANINNALRQKMNQILNNEKLLKGFNKQEQEQMRQIVMGTPTGNLARKIGKLAPSGVVSGALGLEIGSHLLGALGGGAGALVPIAGSIAKAVGEASTTKGLNKLGEMTRSRSPLANQLNQIPQVPAKPPIGGMLPLIANKTAPAFELPTAAAANQQDVPRPEQQKNGGRIENKKWGGSTKLTHKAVHYVEQSPHKNKRCGNCSMFREGPHCTLVQDPIVAAGYCTRYAKAKKMASGGKVDTPNTVEEKPRTLQLQQEQLVHGIRHAQMFPRGVKELKLPKGMARVKSDGHIFHYNPQHVRPADIHKAVKTGRENDILNLGPYSKQDILGRNEHPVAVTERHPDGTEVRAAFGTHATAPHQVAYFEQTKTPGHHIQVENPLVTLGHRMADGGVADDRTFKGNLKSVKDLNQTLNYIRADWPKFEAEARPSENVEDKRYDNQVQQRQAQDIEDMFVNDTSRNKQ